MKTLENMAVENQDLTHWNIILIRVEDCGFYA